MTLVDAFDYELPPELIAQEPLPRGTARLLLVARDGSACEHLAFGDLVARMPPDALLVLNETRVVPARFLGRRPTGGKAELLLVRPLVDGAWEAFVRTSGRPRPGEVLELEEGAARAEILSGLGAGRFAVRFVGEEALEAAERCGRLPLPPYVRRPERPEDRELYQTVFAREPGAIAAPTAGLHFTPAILSDLEDRGVQIARVVLHVGPGTFTPVRCERVEDHRMERERYRVPPETERALANARACGRPIVACGTTVVRTLEAYAQSGVPEGETNLFIHPPYAFRLVDGLITNFHLPRSTLLMLVSALAGVDVIRRAYAEAVRARYRFYSYGDAMFIPPPPS
ncbi:MAG: tRNA preQ1(34) S-adenosylmethionine ribosyltransferase-isomerase QueA [Planctomycetota bacterium]|nr:MAG: tRNA preQ1(34) S-adenosylmethionine ribosyltransferase-isomerase QueA [Planctomycetota bacterium]